MRPLHRPSRDCLYRPSLDQRCSTTRPASTRWKGDGTLARLFVFLALFFISYLYVCLPVGLIIYLYVWLSDCLRLWLHVCEFVCQDEKLSGESACRCLAYNAASLVTTVMLSNLLSASLNVVLKPAGHGKDHRQFLDRIVKLQLHRHLRTI